MTAGRTTVPGVIPILVTPTEEEGTVAATPAAVTVVADATSAIRDAMTAVATVVTTRDVLMHTPWSQSAAAPGHVTEHVPGLRPQDAAIQGAAQDTAPGTVLAGDVAALPALTFQ